MAISLQKGQKIDLTKGNSGRGTDDSACRFYGQYPLRRF